MQAFEFLKEGLATDLTQLLVDEAGMTFEQALDTLYNSETFALICNPATGLYIQSARHLFAHLQQEISTGRYH